MPPARVLPALGSWLTDGTRLVEVRDHRPNGDLLVLDALAPVPGGGEPVQHFTVKAHEFDTGTWVTPEEWRARASG